MDAESPGKKEDGAEDWEEKQGAYNEMARERRSKMMMREKRTWATMRAWMKITLLESRFYRS